MVLVESDWLEMTCSGTTGLETGSSGTWSGIGIDYVLVDEAISWLGSCCWGISVITSSEAMLDALSWLVSYSGSSPE